MKLVTVKQLSKIISIKESTLYAWVNQALIPSYKLNGVLRFDLEEIENWIKNSRIESKPTRKQKTKSVSNKGVEILIKTAIASAKKQSYNSHKGNQTYHARKGADSGTL